MKNTSYRSQIKKFIANEYKNQKVTLLKRLSNALTTIAYRVEFEKDESIIIKVAYDKNDIEEAKGDKESYVLNLIKEIAPEINTPVVDKYFKTYEGFPGYIIILKVLPGVTLTVKEFSIIANHPENIHELAKQMLLYHKYSVNYYTAFTDTKEYSFREFMNKYKGKFEKVLKDDNEVLNKLYDLEKVYEYFKNHKLVLIHRDIKFNNLLFDNNKLSGIIDWEGAFTAPLPFEFAHVYSFAEKYGFTLWINNLIADYAKLSGHPNLLEEVKIASLFCYFRWLARTIDHMSSENGICVDTGEREVVYYKRKIIEWNQL